MATETDRMDGAQLADEKIAVNKAEFSELTEDARGPALSLDLVLDISMPVTVELGRTCITVQDLLDLKSGSVIKLDKMAGDTADLYVRE